MTAGLGSPALLSLRPRQPLRSGLALWSGRASRPCRPWFPGRPLLTAQTLLAAGALWSGLAL
ncbi:MAG TPA: hypothetical protein VF788_10955, partial [Pseudonocardiaceae bacterium]